MKVYTNNKFEGFYPVGVGAVVVAENAKEAAEMLNDELRRLTLNETAKEDDMELLSTTFDGVRMLSDGNY